MCLDSSRYVDGLAQNMFHAFVSYNTNHISQQTHWSEVEKSIIF